MDASGRNFSSSLPSRRSPSPRGNERDENDRELGFAPQNPKPVAKNFMSPTISAASKASFSKKKILCEINRHPESVSAAHPAKAPFSDSEIQKMTQTLEHKFPDKAPISDSQDPDCFKDELSFPYDPVKNYLSPRPQFLRYNPSRRIEISQRLKMEAETEDEVSSSSIGIESVKDSDEEGGNVKGKSYLAASSSECHSGLEVEEFDDESEDEIEEEEEKKGWGMKGLMRSVLVFILLVISTSYISSMNSPPHAFYSEYAFCDVKGAEMSVFGLNHTVPNVEIDEISGDIDLGVVVSVDAIATSILDDGKVGISQLVRDAKQEGESEDVSGIEMVEDVEEREMISRGEDSEQIVEDIESKEFGTIENDLCIGVDQAPRILDGMLSQRGISNAMVVENEDMVVAEAVETIDSIETTIEKAIESEVVNEAVLEKENLLVAVGSEISPQMAIGVLICCVLVASLISVQYIKRRNMKARKDSSRSHVKVAFLQPPAAKKPSLAELPHERQEHSMPWNSSFQTFTPLISSNMEDSKVSNQSRAPTVQLLGEFAVEEINTSFRTLDIKSNIKEDNQAGNSSVLAPKKSSAQAQSDFLEYSAVFSTPQGSKNQLKRSNMDGEDNNEGKDSITTTLRRSARLRSRTVSHS